MPRNVNQHHRAATLSPQSRTPWEWYILDVMNGEDRSKALWAAVVNHAIREARSDDPVERVEARIWLGCDADPEVVGTFPWICDILPLNAAVVRDAVLR